jgi:phosphohistidine phosphatase
MLPKLGAPSKVMVVGHNPGLEELAQELVGGGGGAAQADLAAKFPTCALAAISFEADAWSDVAPGTGRIQHFLTPARLS